MNNNCDGGSCRERFGEVRVLPIGKQGNAILCHRCFLVEMAFRRDTNEGLHESVQYDTPSWAELEVYKPYDVECLVNERE